MRRVAAALAVFAALALLACGHSPVEPPASEPGPRPGTHADLGQAELVLELLRDAAARRVTPADVDAVLAAHGTRLIIQQQNISRAVDPGQYRQLLSHIDREGMPAIAPIDAGERARRGVQGLTENVWPALRWGVANADLLARRLDALRALDVRAAAKELAMRHLPGPVPLDTRLFVVMGGRAGAAAIDGDIYFDVLATSFAVGRALAAYPTPAQITEFFAHEMHHTALSPIIDRTRRALALDAAEARAFDFLSSLAMEGSASYLINGHGRIDEMRADPQFAEQLAGGNQLLESCEQLLRDLLERGLDGEAHERALAPFTGSGFHAAGALLLDAVHRDGGQEAIMAVLRDPRGMLVAFNRASARLQGGARPAPVFDDALARRVAAMGD
jgi:Putative zinc dependent peptidase (DUF5700)